MITWWITARRVLERIRCVLKWEVRYVCVSVLYHPPHHPTESVSSWRTSNLFAANRRSFALSTSNIVVGTVVYSQLLWTARARTSSYTRQKTVTVRPWCSLWVWAAKHGVPRAESCVLLLFNRNLIFKFVHQVLVSLRAGFVFRDEFYFVPSLCDMVSSWEYFWILCETVRNWVDFGTRENKIGWTEITRSWAVRQDFFLVSDDDITIRVLWSVIMYWNWLKVSLYLMIQRERKVLVTCESKRNRFFGCKQMSRFSSSFTWPRWLPNQ